MPCAPIVLSQHLVEYVFLFLHKQPILLPFLGELNDGVASNFGLGTYDVFTFIGLFIDLTINKTKV
jgi:hypothetical protein